VVEFLSMDEADSVVLLVEVWVELSHEGVSEDEVVELSWEVLTHNSENALSLRSLGNSKDVVSWGKGVVDVVNLEGDIW